MTEYSVNEIATACSKPRNDAHNNVILNVVKNLKASQTVDGSVNLEILRAAQDDKTQQGDCHGLFQASQ